MVPVVCVGDHSSESAVLRVNDGLHLLVCLQESPVPEQTEGSIKSQTCLYPASGLIGGNYSSTSALQVFESVLLSARMLLEMSSAMDRMVHVATSHPAFWRNPATPCLAKRCTTPRAPGARAQSPVGVV